MKDISEAEKAMIHALAEVIIVEKLTKTMMVVGATEKGNTIVERHPDFPDPTPAEAKWKELQTHYGSGGYTPREQET